MKKTIMIVPAVCLILMCGLSFVFAAEPPHLSLNTAGAAVAVPGKVTTLTLDAEGVTGFVDKATQSGVTGYQYDLYFDEGITLVGDAGKDIGTPGDACPNDWTYRFTKSEDGTYGQFLVFSAGKSKYESRDGRVAEFQVKIADNAAIGSKLKIYLVNSGGTVAGTSGNLDTRTAKTIEIGGKKIEGVVQTLELTVSEKGASPKGDIDGNGVVNVADIIMLKNLVMNNNWTGEQLLVGDMDNNGTLNVSDIISIKNIIMSGK